LQIDLKLSIAKKLAKFVGIGEKDLPALVAVKFDRETKTLLKNFYSGKIMPGLSEHGFWSFLRRFSYPVTPDFRAGEDETGSGSASRIHRLDR
jgi:hypothetical protein